MDHDEQLRRAIQIVETSRQTHVEWLAWQEHTPNWRDRVKPESPGMPEHHRQYIAEYDVVLGVLKRNGGTAAKG